MGGRQSSALLEIFCHDGRCFTLLLWSIGMTLASILGTVLYRSFWIDNMTILVNFLANNYYALSSLTILDEKVCLAGILFMAVIVLYKLVRQMMSRRCFFLGSLAQNASTSEFVPELPDDILMEILVRLPASSIFHFRSVSRSFRSLVLESHTCNGLPPVLVGVFYVSICDENVVYVSLRKGFGDSSMDYGPTQFLEESSLFYQLKDCKFGLVLCTKSWVSKKIYLCNPATKKCRSIAYNGRDDRRFVLAFDPSWSKHHYEVIRISYNHVGSGYIFEVFSSKTGGWDRKFSVTDYHIILNLHSCFANGLLYMFERCYSGLVAINCADGSYKRVTLPCHNRGEKVGALCNSSGTLMYSKLCRGEVNVWTLLKNENESCWLLRHQINLEDKMKKIGFSFPFDTDNDECFDCTLLFHLDTIVLNIDFKTFYYNLETDQLQADMSRAYDGLLFPWSPCYYAVAGL